MRRPAASRPRTAAFLLAAVALAATGCGYRTSRLSSFGGGATIAVVPFENLGFRRDLAQRLSQAIAAEVRGRTSYAITSPDRADYVLEGRMSADEFVILQDENFNVIEKRLAGRAQVVIRDRRSGQTVQSFQVGAMAEYTPGRDGEGLETTATDDWVRRMAIRVVDGMEGDL